MYEANYGVLPHSDIRTFPTASLRRKTDLLTAGFPCTPYSSLGKQLGLKDPRGKLFHDLCRVIKEVEPRVFILENVKNLLSSESRLKERILAPLKDLGYQISYTVLDSRHFGIPQHRERVYFVGIREPAPFASHLSDAYTFSFQSLIDRAQTARLVPFDTILEKNRCQSL